MLMVSEQTAERMLVAFAFIMALILLFVIVDDAHGQELPQAPSATTRTFDKRFAAATAITLASAAADAWSTSRNLDHGYTENNIILGQRPAKWNVWALCMGESAGWSTVAYFAKRATKNSPNRVIRNSWLVFHILSAGGHTRGWIHNVAIYDPVRYPKRP